MTPLRTGGLSSGFGHAGLMYSDTDFTPSPRQEKSKKAISNSKSRPMSDGIMMGTSSTFDRLMVSMGTLKGGESSSTRLQPQLTSSSLGFTPVLRTASDASAMFATVMTGLEELRQDVTGRIDRAEERAQQGHQRLRDELPNAKLQARSDQSQLIRNTDQRLAESLDLATKGSEERDSRRQERLLNDHDIPYAHTRTSLEKRLDAKADLMMRRS